MGTSIRDRLKSFQVSRIRVYIVSLNVGIEVTSNIACDRLTMFMSRSFLHFTDIIHHICYPYVT